LNIYTIYVLIEHKMDSPVAVESSRLEMSGALAPESETGGRVENSTSSKADSRSDLVDEEVRLP
jgi:hypothetical protein